MKKVIVSISAAICLVAAAVAFSNPALAALTFSDTGVASSGVIGLDGAGAVSIGTANATSIAIGKSGVTSTVNGTLTVAEVANLNGNTTIGNAATDALTVTSEIRGGSPLSFEGNTNDNIYTIFAITDPTGASKTITFPNASGTVAVSATGPITLSADGDIGCATCVTSTPTVTLQDVYDNGQNITTSGGHDIAFTLASGNLTASGAGSVSLTPSGAITFTAGAASTWSTSAGALTLDSAAALNLGTTNATSIAIGNGSINTAFNGNVGIGTASPNNRLQVNDLINFNDTQFTTALGSGAMHSATTPTASMAIGWQSGYNLTSGINNTFVGTQSGTSTTTAFGNTALGAYTLLRNVVGSVNTAVGTGALYNNLQDGNSAFGNYTLWGNTTGYHNTGLGYKALEGNSTGYGNTSVGFDSSLYNTTGIYNVAMGESALRFVSRSNYNTAIGAFANYFHPNAIGGLALAAGGNLGVGLYVYRASFVLDGIETPPGAVATVTTTTGNQTVDLSVLPTYSGPKVCTARKIYRTKFGAYGSGDGNSPYYLVTTINDNVTTVYSDAKADADLGAEPTDLSGSIMLGYNSLAFGSGQMVVGSHEAPISSLYLGGGVYDSTPTEVSINASGAQGTDVAGANLVLAGGIGTGAGNGGSILFKTSPVGVSSSLANGLSSRMAISGNGYVGIGTTTPLETFHIHKGTNQNLMVRSGTILGGGNGIALQSVTDAFDGEMMLILSASPVVLNGSVGVGTTSPSKALSVGANLWQADSAGITWSNGAQTTYTGSTSGTAAWSMPEQGSAYKKFVIYFNALNDAGGTITYPTAFAHTPYIYGTAACVSAMSSNTTTLTLGATAGVTGYCFVEGN